MEISVDVAIIGAGTAGISAFKEASKITKKIILIDHGPLGTTCARIGCMPSKAFIQAANFFHDRLYFSERGISPNQFKINIPKMMRYVRKIRDDFTSGIVEYLKSLGDRVIIGTAEICEPNVIMLDHHKIIANKIILATGTSSMIPFEWQFYSNNILTSENFFEQLSFEKRIGVIGAGAIGLELGQALSRIGIHINLFHANETIGKLTDPEVNDVAIEIMREEFPLHLNQKVELEKNKKVYTIKGKKNHFEAKQILAALGRKPNLSNIDFKKLGIKTDKAGMPPFDNTMMKINNSNLFIAGDITKERQLLHEAADEGRIAGYNAVHDTMQCFHRRTPLAIIFTEPNIAIIGKSYSSLNNTSFLTGKVNFKNQGRSRIMSKNKGILHIYAESNTGKLLGAEMIAPAGEHLAHLLAWAIQYEMTVFDILKMPYYHPTIEEGMRTAIRELALQIKPHQTEQELPMCDSEAISTLA